MTTLNAHGVEDLCVVGGMEHDPLNHGSLNISDVIEVIQTTDPEFADGGSRMFPTMDESRQQVPYVKIVEQPASKALRFRYECEGRSAGSIPGVSSTPENKTFPSIQIVGYRGRAVVVVSCVTKDPPYRPHPHNLVGKEGCKKGVCTVEITSENMVVSFSNLGIQCVKKKDIDEALKVREEIRVDPFRTGFAHRSQPTSIDLNAVRLCFQVFLEGAERGKFTNPLPPVVSDPIFDKKAMSDLVICKLSDCTCSVAGGKEIILLCEKVAKEDIQVRFYEEHNGHLVWEGFGDFQPTHVHKQVAISFRTPRYRSLEVERPVKAQIQLRRPSDGATSEPLPFEFIPLESDPKRKRPKEMRLPEMEKAMLQQLTGAGNFVAPQPSAEQKAAMMLQHPAIKREPVEGVQYTSFVGGGSQMFGGGRPMVVGSPHSVGRTPSPMDYVLQQQHQYQPILLEPGGSGSKMHHDLIIQGGGGRAFVGLPGAMRVQQMQSPVCDGAGNILDLDSQHVSLGQIDSGDLASLGIFDNNLSENLSNNLNLGEPTGTSMTDSLTRITNNALQELCSMNSAMYKGAGE